LLLDYLDRNPACNGVFAAWELANKSNNSPLSAAALSCLTSLVRLASTDPFTSSNSELLKALFSTQYAPYFERSLNPGRNDVTTAVLKLANVLVGFAGGKYARKVFNSFTWSPKVSPPALFLSGCCCCWADALPRPRSRVDCTRLASGV
jgi:hypothetical protein